ncbi:hypothetical protein GGF37_000391 [Kickxella alabastrina]|nr:hypothetical protein GGF37_000391 [Kickxella alabastrina]
MQDSSAFHSGNAGYSLACAQPSMAAALAEAAGENSRRRTRTTLTPYQLRVLFRVWERIQYPSSDLRSRLASNLMMTPRNVQIWFQNQRQKTKERAELRRRTHSPSMHAAVIASIRTSSSHHGHIAQHQPLPAYQHHHVYSSPLAYPTDFGARESHPSAISMPGRSPPESPFRYTHGPPPAPPTVQPSPQYHEHSATAAAFAGENMSMHRASEASSAYSMLTPPALYPYTFTQHPSSQQQQQRSPVIPPHAHHYTHARPSSSAPAPPHYPASPSFLQDSLTQRQQHSSVQKYISLRAPEMSSERVQPTRLSQHSGSSPIDIQHTIPSPATPIFSAEHMHNHSPRLLSSMSMLTMASPVVAASNSPRLPYEQPASRRTRLTDILNPIDHATENTATDNNSSSNSHLERLPSLGSVLAYVQSESADSSSAMNTTSTGSETNAAGTSLAAEKWRPW